MFLKRLKALEFGIGSSFCKGPGAMGSWAFDKEPPFERIRILDPAPKRSTVTQTMARARALYPALKDVAIRESWSGCVDSTPDAMPVISQVAGLKGFVLAAGCSGHGFGLGPGVGHLAADLAVDHAPIVDPYPYRHSRLLDGSRGEIGEF